MCLDPTCRKPARQPKAVAAGFEGQGNPRDLFTGADGHAEGLDRLRALFSNLISSQSDVTAIEYALIAALIAVAAIAAFTLVGTNLSTTFSTIAGQL